jgi:hypothetical protein
MGKKLKLFLGLIEHHGMKTYGGVEVELQHLTSALDGGEWSASQPCHFTPAEGAPGTHCTGGWVGAKTRLDVTEKKKISCLYRK